MAIDGIDRFKTSVVNNSITNNDETNYEDRESPFSLSEWVEKTGNTPGFVEKYTNDYNRYLKNWRSKVDELNSITRTTSKDTYVRFLKEVQLREITPEEQRFLNTLDLQNPEELDTGLHFYTKKLREIIQFIYKNRHPLKFQKIKLGMKGSSIGVEKAIFDKVVQFEQKVAESDRTDNFYTDPGSGPYVPRVFQD